MTKIELQILQNQITLMQILQALAYVIDGPQTKVTKVVQTTIDRTVNLIAEHAETGGGIRNTTPPPRPPPSEPFLRG